jgi:hypothetical protein
MHSAGFEPALLVLKRPQTHTADRTGTGIGAIDISIVYFMPIAVVARSKACVGGSSLTGIAGSSPAGGMDVCLL